LIDYGVIMKLADQKYRELKAEKYPFTDPELLPEGIVSDQIRALAHALVIAINVELNKPSRP
jgi:hypothetical protein